MAEIVTGGNIEDAVTVYQCRSLVVPGCGARLVQGSLDVVAQEAAHVAISWASINAEKLCAWLGRGGGASSRLYTSTQDVGVFYESPRWSKEGPSGGAVAALSLSVWLGRCKLMDDEVVVTGEINMRGMVLEIGKVDEKIRHAMGQGVGTFIMPAVNYAQWEGGNSFLALPCELREYARKSCRPAANMVDVLKAAIPGKNRPAFVTWVSCMVWSMASSL